MLLGFKAHCCLQQPLISRGGNMHCVNLSCAVRPQRVAEDSSSFLPSPMPCSPADSAACPHSPPCSPHPSHTVCFSFRHPPPKLENPPPDVPKAAWSITLATLVTLSVQKSTPKQFFLYSLKAMVLKKAPPLPWKVYRFWRRKYSLTTLTVQLAGFGLLAEEIFLSVSVLTTKMTLHSSASPAELLE